MELALCCKTCNWLVFISLVLAFRNLLEEEDEDKGPSPLMMVPVADILNCVANHNASLEYSLVNAKLLQQAASCSGSLP